MRAVLTRVSSASVSIDGETVGAIGRGFLVLLGVHVGDTEADAERIADRICGLRIFEDAAGKMNVTFPSRSWGADPLCWKTTSLKSVDQNGAFAGRSCQRSRRTSFLTCDETST